MVEAAKNPLISVIIPLYNKERYITKCLQSIQNQSIESWECIIINDGSTDRSANFVREFTKKDERFKLYEQGNSGPSVARNKGIFKSHGKLIHFLDADDYYPNENVFRRIIDAYSSSRYHAIAGSIGVFSQESDRVDYSLGVNSHGQSIKTFYDIQNDYFFSRFFYDREFILDNNILFPEYTYVGEDPVFLVKALSRMEDGFLVTDIPVYVYNRQGSENSNFSDYDDTKILGYMKAQIEVLKIAKEKKYTKLIDTMASRIDGHMLSTYIKRGLRDDEIFNRLLEIEKYVDIRLRERIDQVLVDIANEKMSDITRQKDALEEAVYQLSRPGVKTSLKLLLYAGVRYLKRTVR